MSRWEIPDGWEWVKIDDIADVIGGGTPPSKDPKNFSTDGIPWLTPADLTGYRDTYIGRGARDLSELGLSKSSARILPKGSVLFTSRAPIGYCAIASQPLATNQGFKSLELPSSVSPEFLRYYLLASKDYAESLSSGTTFPELSAARMRELELPLAPALEQRRIAAKIEALQQRSQRARDALSEVEPLLEQFRQSVLAEAFRGDLTADWRASHPNIEPASELLQRIRAERRHHWEQAELAKYETRGQKPPKNWQEKYEELEPVNDSELPKLPGGWSWIRVEELASDLPRSIQSGPFGSNLLHSEFQDSGILAIGIDNVHRDGFSLGQRHRISREKYEELKKYTARPLDVLITVMATVGRCCLVPEDLETAIITKHVYRITLEQRLINPHFLVFAFQGSAALRKQLDQAIRGQTRPGINGQILKSLAIPVPPRQEQDIICEKVNNQIAGINDITKLASETLEYLDQLDQSILAKAFRGELVPQDPNDEPAYILLNRIQEHRAQQEETTTRQTTKTRRSDTMGKKSSRVTSKRRPLSEVLTARGQHMAPEQLLTEAGYDDDSIEDFYASLREEIRQGRIREKRPSESDVFLEAIAS